MRFLPLSWLRGVLDTRCWLRPSVRLVLLALVRHTSAEQGEAWPGRARLAKETGYSESTIKRALRELEGLGLIGVSWRGGGRGRTTRYHLDAEPPEALHAARPQKTGSLRPGRNRVTDSRPKGVTKCRAISVHPEELITPEEVMAFVQGLGAA
jgi:DNA-binding transcriptional MocR family regulator